MSPSELHSNTEPYGFRATDLYSDPGYPMPPVQFNGNDTTGGYQYHTFAMEWLPHEVRILIDSVVVRRFPDRMVPPGTPYSDWITTLPRALADLLPAEIGIDHDNTDLFGADTSHASPGWWGSGFNSPAYVERQYFQHAAAFELAHPTPGWPGFEMVDGKPVAHHLLDYVKVWDIPKDVQIPTYPH